MSTRALRHASTAAITTVRHQRAILRIMSRGLETAAAA